MASHSADTAPRTAEKAAGSPREVLGLAFPVVLTNVSVTLLGVVDAAFVGRLGPSELGALGFGAIWFWTALCLFMGTATGVQTFVSQAEGRGAPRECGRWAWQGLWILPPAAALLMSVFALVFEPLVALVNPSPELPPLSASYVHARAWGAPASVAGLVLASFFRGIGDTRTPLYAMVAANLLNVVLDYGLIFGNLGLPRWEIAGAGIASSIAEYGYAALLLLAFRRRRLDARFATAPVAPKRDDVRRLSRVSLPIGGQWVLEMITFALFTSIVARMGVNQMAASHAFLQVLHLSFMQVLGISVAATTLVGRYVGAGDPAAAARSYASAMKLALVFAVGVAGLFLAAPELLIRIFTEDADVLTLGRPLLAVGAAFQLLDAIGIVASGALRGAGDTRWPFVVQTATAWLVFLPLSWLFGVGLGGGLVGAWLAGCVHVVALAAAFALRFRSGAWRRATI